MKRSQSTFVIFAMLMLAVMLTGFKAKSTSSNAVLDTNEISIEQHNPNVLVGTWVKRDDPEVMITFNADKTVVEVTKEKTTNNTWSHKDKDREVCIGSSRCIYYEATEKTLFLYINKKKVVYLRSSQ